MTFTIPTVLLLPIFAVFAALIVAVVRFPKWFVQEMIQLKRWEVRDQIVDEFGLSTKDPEAKALIEVAERETRDRSSVTADLMLERSNNGRIRTLYSQIEALRDMERSFGSFPGICRSLISPRQSTRKLRECRNILAS